MSDLSLEQVNSLKKQAENVVFTRDAREIAEYARQMRDCLITHLEFESKVESLISAEFFNLKAQLRRTIGIKDEHEYGIGSTIGAMP